LSLAFVCCVGSGLCHQLITCLEESYRACVHACDLETPTMGPLGPVWVVAPPNPPPPPPPHLVDTEKLGNGVNV
jgi:hypothetical protein